MPTDIKQHDHLPLTNLENIVSISM